MKESFLKNKRRFFALFACILMTAAIGIYTYSKFLSDESIGGSVNLEEFYAIARLYYTSDGVEKEVTVDPDNRKEYVELTPAEFATVRVDIEYTGKAKTYCRFKLDCSWLRDVTDTYRDENGNTVNSDYTELIPHQYPELECDEVIYDNVNQDGWLYIKDIMETDGENKKTVHAITHITVGDDLIDKINENDESEYVHIMLTVDCVQYNRVSALWNMNTLPWWGN